MYCLLKALTKDHIALPPSSLPIPFHLLVNSHLFNVSYSRQTIDFGNNKTYVPCTRKANSLVFRVLTFLYSSFQDSIPILVGTNSGRWWEWFPDYLYVRMYTYVYVYKYVHTFVYVCITVLSCSIRTQQ